jgi:hypothetical protein
MRTYQKLIAGGLVIAGLSGLLGCDRNGQDLEKRVEKAPYTSVESEQVGEEYQRFRSENNIGHSRNGASHTAANLSFAGALSGKTFEELDNLYDQYRSLKKIGHSRNGASETASILVNATIINPEYNDPNIIIQSYNFFRGQSNIGHSRDGASKTAAILTYATALNSGNPEKVLEIYDRFRDERNIGHSRNGASHTAAQLTLSTVIKENGYRFQK